MLSMGKSTISMAVFKSFLYVYQRVYDSLKAGKLLPILGENPEAGLPPPLPRPALAACSGRSPNP